MPPNPKLNPFAVAQAYWAIPVKDRTLRRLAEVLGLHNQAKTLQNRLGRLVLDWEAKGRVRHVVLPDAPGKCSYLPREPEMEDSLCRFFGLRGAAVVDVSSLAPAYDPQVNAAAWMRYDDKIHEHLGLWAGRLLMALVRPTDILGVGGGRGPYYTARDCVVSSWGTTYPQQVVSLTGQMATRAWAEDNRREDGLAPRSLDADAIASLLAYMLGTKLQPRRLDRPIVNKEGDPPLKTEDVTVALVGIGALAGGHRLVRHRQSEDLQAISKELEHLNRLVNKLDPPIRGAGPHHHWVGDVCNSLFVVERSSTENSLRGVDRASLEKVVRALTEKRFLNTSPPALTDICQRGAVVAVAGGPHKASAISHVLWKSKTTPWITHLVTDAVLACKILQEIGESP